MHSGSVLRGCVQFYLHIHHRWAWVWRERKRERERGGGGGEEGGTERGREEGGRERGDRERERGVCSVQVYIYIHVSTFSCQVESVNCLLIESFEKGNMGRLLAYYRDGLYLSTMFCQVKHTSTCARTHTHHIYMHVCVYLGNLLLLLLLPLLLLLLPYYTEWKALKCKPSAQFDWNVVTFGLKTSLHVLGEHNGTKTELYRTNANSHGFVPAYFELKHQSVLINTYRRQESLRIMLGSSSI